MGLLVSKFVRFRVLVLRRGGKQTFVCVVDFMKKGEEGVQWHLLTCITGCSWLLLGDGLQGQVLVISWHGTVLVYGSVAQ